MKRGKTKRIKEEGKKEGKEIMMMKIKRRKRRSRKRRRNYLITIS